MGGRGSKGTKAGTAAATVAPPVTVAAPPAPPPPVPTQSGVQSHAAFLADLRNEVNAGHVEGITQRADAYLAKVKGKELDALVKHYGITTRPNAADKRLSIREYTVGRLISSVVIDKVARTRR